MKGANGRSVTQRDPRRYTKALEAIDKCKKVKNEEVGVWSVAVVCIVSRELCVLT